MNMVGMLLDLLKTKEQKEKAKLQDTIINIIYNKFDDVVIHGGTAVWRCYGGERFSKDIDLYVPTANGAKKIILEIKRNGLRCEEKQLRKTRKGIINPFIVGSYYDVKLDFNIVHKSYRFYYGDYLMASSGIRKVITLYPEELIVEKIMAYEDRQEARDVYDIWILSGKADLQPIGTELRRFISDLKAPKNYRELADTVYGFCPTFEQMQADILRRVHEVRK